MDTHFGQLNVCVFSELSGKITILKEKKTVLNNHLDLVKFQLHRFHMSTSFNQIRHKIIHDDLPSLC